MATSVSLRRRASSLRRVLRFTLEHGKVVQAEVIADPVRLRKLELVALND
jgi:hypothetical protein